MPRRDFLPSGQRTLAAVDQALSIGHGQTNSQPTTVRDMLRLLDVRPGDRILDVGSGSAWSTALLAWLTGPTGRVVGVERVPQLVVMGRRHLDRADLPWARIEPAEGDVLGFPADAPYDRILVSAEARRIPEALVDQLGPDGVMVAPASGRMARVHRRGDGAPEVTWHGHYRFVPLVSP